METKWNVDDLCRRKQQNKANLAEFLNRFPWEWFGSLSLGGAHKPVHFAETNLKRWRTRLSINAHIQIAYMGLINHWPYSHIHLFMLGHNREGQTLRSKNPTMWESWWPNDACIEAIHNQEGAIDYLVKKNMPDGQYELLTPYGLKHLKRFC